MIFLKLMSIIGDMLFYNQDMQSLEVYPNSVTQRKNAATIYKLIGYKMRWYQSASLEANVVNTYSNGATLPRFCTFSTENNDTIYTTWEDYELPSNMTNNGLETLVELVQGIPVTPVRSSSSPYPEVGKPWHSIYGFNYTEADVINNRIYLNDNNIDQDHIILVDDKNEEWKLMENIYLTKEVGKLFEFGVDVNDTPYLELIDYWGNFNISKFKVFYLRSKGEAGQIYANTLRNLNGNVWSRTGTGDDETIYNVSSFIHFTHYDSTLGYDPETPDEARKNSVLYQNTLDTLITLADFERAVLREPGVANVRATDLTNDPGTAVSFTVGNIKKYKFNDTLNNTISETITEEDYELLSNYLADPSKHPLTAYQKKLADINQDGVVDTNDLACLRAYLNGDSENSGYCGIRKINDIELLESFVVKLYVLLEEEHEDAVDGWKESFINQIKSDLEDYKILPLTIQVDLDSINKYYWTVEGTFFTKKPLSRDELQTIIVNINNNLRYNYSLNKTNFNTIINYKEVIETILAVDDRILMVDLKPITYKDSEGNVVSKEQLTGDYVKTVIPLQNMGDLDEDNQISTKDLNLLKDYIDGKTKLTDYQLKLADMNQDGKVDMEDYNIIQEKIHNKTNNIPDDVLTYDIILDHTTILPGSVMIRVNNGQYLLRDNNNGTIANVDNILAKKGNIDYVTGKIHLEFSQKLESDLIINYTHNQTNVAVYRNLSTQTFYFDASSLENDGMQDII